MNHSGRYLFIVYTFVLIIYIANIFLEIRLLDDFLNISAVILLIISFPGAPRLFKILGTGFMAVGFYFHFSVGGTLWEIPSLLTDNYSLLGLLLMLPWMKSVVESGRFDRHIARILERKAGDLGMLYPRSLFTSVLLTSFLNLSAAPITQGVLRKNLKDMSQRVRNSFISKASLRGTSIALVWSPLEVLIALTIFITGAAYVELLPWLLLTALLMFITDAVWNRFAWRKYKLNTEHMLELSGKEMRIIAGKMMHMLTALSLFLAAVIILGNITGLDFILTVTLVIFPFALLWSFWLKRHRRFLILGWHTWKEKTNKMQNFFVLFISLSFFANTLAETDLLELLRTPINTFADYPLIIFMIIQGSFIFMSLFGVHPIATIGILSGVTPVILEIISPMSFSILLITSSIATLTVNTYGLFVQMTAINTGENPYRITWNNLPFAAVYCLIGMGVAYLLL
ncbi:hypothetical protein [Alkalicoccus halolimnae]|uniref:Citrate transporter-like domain-containing protein n=1 Tax=Alkalicoccus halolimnae TaxID=1667239 RepID=A0A5C7FC62_9BACI|nr:hypothetical protein [Alkalicoccus halolimnae]TXF84618.1 hypothetical protein FTX54_10480 [Alkalicoccus halolimnae]